MILKFTNKIVKLNIQRERERVSYREKLKKGYCGLWSDRIRLRLREKPLKPLAYTRRKKQQRLMKQRAME
jgi:hypothetical protein